MTRPGIILIVVGTFSVLLPVTGALFILSTKHAAGAVPATAPSPVPIPAASRATATAFNAASVPAEAVATAFARSAPFDAPSPEDPASAESAAESPDAAAIGGDSAAEQAKPGKQSMPADASVFRPSPIPPALEQDFLRRSFVKDAQSGNYMGPRLSSKTLHEPLVPIPIDGTYAKDLRGHTVFLRKTIRDKLLAADAAMFKSKGQHLQVNYGFRSNALQYELYQQLNGHGKVAQAGMSFHETGMAIDLQNWRDAQRFMIEAGFVGGCYGIEEDLVHYSIDEITKSSDFQAFRRCTLKEIPKDILKGVGKVGNAITSHLPGHTKNQ